MSSETTITSVIFFVIKLVAAMFILKVLLMIVGFNGYIPGLSEVFDFFMGLIFSMGGRSVNLPQPL